MENQAVDMKKAQDDAQVSSLYSHREISNKIGGGMCQETTNYNENWKREGRGYYKKFMC